MNNYILVNGVEIDKFKTKYSEINEVLLCLDYVSKDILVDNMERDWIIWVCLFIFELITIVLMLINLKIHKYLIKKHDIN